VVGIRRLAAADRRVRKLSTKAEETEHAGKSHRKGFEPRVTPEKTTRRKECRVSKSNISQSQVSNGHAPPSETPAPALDSIDQFRIDQNYSLHLQTRKKAVLVPVLKPDRQQWVYLHETWRVPVSILEDKVNGRYCYVLTRELLPDITEDVTPKMLAYIAML
jgi:hypothetical protein